MNQVCDWWPAIFYIPPPRLSSCLANQLVKFVTLYIVLAWFIPESEEYRIQICRNQKCIWIFRQVYWYFCQKTLIRICTYTWDKMCSSENELLSKEIAVDLQIFLGFLQKRRHVCWICTNPTSLFPPSPIIDAAKVQISEKGGWLCDPIRGQVGLSWFEVRSSEEPGGIIAD